VVGLAGEERLDLPARHLPGEALDGRFRFPDDLGIAIGFTEVDQPDVVVQLLLGLLHR